MKRMRGLHWLVLASIVSLVTLAGCGQTGLGQGPGRLVFERTQDGETEIYAINSDGSGLVRLTDSPGWDGTPVWSPDGQQIAFASERLGAPVIFVMNADGSDPRPLTDPSYASLMPAWSPDGQQIAFSSTQQYEIPGQGGRQVVDAGFELWVMQVDGGQAQRLTGDPNDQSLYPTWGPDSDELAFMRVGDEVRIAQIAAAADSAARSLTDAIPGRHWTPAWSPGGDRIALMVEDEGARDIWLVDRRGEQPVQLAMPGSDEGEPAWSANGARIAFVSSRDGNLALYVMDADGQNVQRVSPDDADYAHPDWTGN